MRKGEGSIRPTSSRSTWNRRAMGEIPMTIRPLVPPTLHPTTATLRDRDCGGGWEVLVAAGHD